MQEVVAAGGHVPEAVASLGCPCWAPKRPLPFSSPGAAVLAPGLFPKQSTEEITGLWRMGRRVPALP